MNKNKNDKPAIHSQTSAFDVEAVSTLTAILAHNGRVAPDLRYRDTWPNIDGYLELTLDDGVPDGKLEVQVKRIHFEKDGSIKFSFEDDKFLNYCREIKDLPILFIGVDLEGQQAFWIEMSTTYVASLTSRTIQVPTANIITRGSASYHSPWKKICDERKQILRKNQIAAGRGIDSLDSTPTDPQRSAIEQLFVSESKSELLVKNQSAVDSIIENIRAKILLYEGHLFLVSPTYINDSKIRETIRKNLDISIQQEELFIDELTKQNILGKTGDVIVFNEEDLGQEKIGYLVKNDLINIDKVYDSFPDLKARKTILRKVVNILNSKQLEIFFNELSSNFLNGLADIKNNDDIIANLELLSEYSFRAPEQTIQIAKQIISSKALPPKAYDSQIGSFEGATHSKLLIETLDTLSSIRYLETKKVLDIAIPLCTHSNIDVKKKALELIKQISEYNIFAMRKIGYYPQQQIVDLLKTWSTEQLKTNLSALLEIGREVLSPEFEGSEMSDYRTFTLSFGPLPVSEDLKNIRNEMAGIIKKLFAEEIDKNTKVKLLNILEEGTRTPNRGEYKQELEQLILNFVNETIMPFYSELINTSSFVVIHEIEGQTHWFIKRFGKEKLVSLQSFQKTLKENKLYQIFRVFFGYDLDFDEELKWREARAKREEIINGYIEQINDESFNSWKKDILTIASNFTPEDPGKFQYFNNFLYKLAKTNPNLAMKLVTEIELQPFLTHLILGLLESEHSDIRRLLLEWIADKKELTTLAEIFWYTKKADFELMRALFDAIVATDNVKALNLLATNIIVSYQGEEEIKTLFIDVIKELNKQKSTNWTFNFFLHESSLLKSLSEHEADILLDNLLFAEDITHDIEEILIPIAESYPAKIINFFYERIQKQIKKSKDSRYDALPYDFHELPKILAKNTDLVLDELFKWFKEKGWLFHFDSPRFLQEIFPGMDDPLKNKLLELIKVGGKDNAEVILRVLRAYEGHTVTHLVIKEFIKKYLQRENTKTYKDYASELFIALSTTGVVTGEYGLPNAYKQKKEEIQNWKTDKSKAIRLFVEKYEEYLDKHIAYHTKRADEDIELMKRGGR